METMASERRAFLDLKLGYRCNNACRMCVTGDKRRVFPDRATDEILQILEQERPRTAGVILTGGEPTVREDLGGIVRRARELGYSPVVVQSNGRRFAYRSYAKELLEAGVTHFAISMHGHMPALHDYVTRVEGSFRQVLMGIRNLLELGATVATNTVILRPNYRHLEEVSSLVLTMGVRQVHFSFVHILGTAERFADSMVPRMALAAPYLLQALARVAEAGGRPGVEGVPPCFLGAFRKCAVEKRNGCRRLIDVGGVVEEWEGQRKVYMDGTGVIGNFEAHRRSDLRSHGEECTACALLDHCEGPWKEYPERHGWDEFKPLAS